MLYHLECIECNKKYNPSEVVYTCTCGGLLDVAYDYSNIHLTKKDLKGPLSVWKYRALIPEYIKDYVSLNQFAA